MALVDRRSPSPALVAFATFALLLATAGVSRAQRPANSPAPGRFLVASPALTDPNFAQTVVLIVDYDANGALGLVVNRPTRETFTPPTSSEENARPLFVGGPVQRERLSILIQTEGPLPECRQVLEDLCFSQDLGLLEALPEGVTGYRVYSGYAGWGPAQLDREMAHGGWFVTAADAGSVLDAEPDRLWRRLLDRASAKWTVRPSTDATAPSRLRVATRF